MKVDCLIVGGGVIGLSLAYELAEHELRVGVIDRRQPGGEASWAGAGILPPANLEFAVHPLDQLRALSQQLHPRWSQALREETGIDNGYRRCGGVYIARTSGEAALLAGFAAAAREEGVAIEKLSPASLAEVDPGLRDLAESGALLSVYFAPDEAQLRNPRHLKALAAACRRRGVDLRAGVEATGFVVDGRRLTSLNTTSGAIEADCICIASGAWTGGLLGTLGVSIGVLPVRGQIVLFRCDAPPFRAIVNEGPRYAVPRDDGRVVVGSSEEEAGFDKSTTNEVLAELIELGRSLSPAMRRAEVEKTWAGLRPGSYDGLPYMGRLPGLDNAFVAAGHYRSGLQLSPAVAVVMSELIRGAETQIDLTPFRISRG